LSAVDFFLFQVDTMLPGTTCSDILGTDSVLIDALDADFPLHHRTAAGTKLDAEFQANAMMLPSFLSRAYASLTRK